jgi:molybdopterin-biosynthesis enzyme MoeA-like protein
VFALGALAVGAATGFAVRLAHASGATPAGDPVLMQAMETELHRAMAELGSSNPAHDDKTVMNGAPELDLYR